MQTTSDGYLRLRMYFSCHFLHIEGMVIQQMHAQGEKATGHAIKKLGAQVHADKLSVVG